MNKIMNQIQNQFNHLMLTYSIDNLFFIFLKVF